MGNVHLSPEADSYFERNVCEVLLKPTPEAIQMFNRLSARRIGLFHVTCRAFVRKDEFVRSKSHLISRRSISQTQRSRRKQTMKRG
jgi:hypothetical protein